MNSTRQKILITLLLLPMATYAMEKLKRIKAEPIEPKSLVYNILTNEKSLMKVFEKNVNKDMNKLLAQDVLRNHPIVAFLLRKIPVASKTLIGHEYGVRSANFNTADDKIVTGSRDNTAKIWNVKDGSCLATFEGHNCIVWSAQFNTAGDKIVTACANDGTVKIWDVETGACLTTIDDGMPFAASFNKAGDKIVTVAGEKTAKIWDLEGTHLATLKGHDAEVLSAQFNNSGDRIVTASDDDTVKIWDVKDCSCLATFEHKGVRSANFNKAGDKIVTAEYTTAKIWDLEGSCLITFEGHDEAVWSAQFNNAGDKIVTASEEKTAKIWDLEGACLATLEGHDESEDGINVHSGQFNTTGDKIVTGSYDGTAKIWDVELLLEIQRFLAKDVTFHQAVILNAIYEVMIARTLVKKYGEKAFDNDGDSEVDDEGMFSECSDILSADDPIFGKCTGFIATGNGNYASSNEVVEKITFDFNKYPHLEEHYKKLPQAIQDILNPYVIPKCDKFQL